MKRDDFKKNAKRIVVKVGSSMLTSNTGYLSKARVNMLVRWLCDLKFEYNKEIILVSSGAIACGMDMLGMKKRPHDLAYLQAAAAVGQGKLINTYKSAFKRKGVHVGQILLTVDGLHNRVPYLNARNTINALLALGAVPIVNENDTVATEEIRFGDNDNLAAQVAMMTNADLLIILSDVDGFCVEEKGKLSVMHTVDKIDHDLKKHIKQVKRGTTVGGMESKLNIGFSLMRLGLPLVIANGGSVNILRRVIEGKKVGTLFLPSEKKQASKKSWLAFAASSKNAGTVFVDEGAEKVLVEKGKSLLPSGIIKVKGTFKFGDAINLASKNGKVFAKGITNFSSYDVEKIMGKRTSQIKAVLGESQYDEVIHRDNLVVLGS